MRQHDERLNGSASRSPRCGAASLDPIEAPEEPDSTQVEAQDAETTDQAPGGGDSLECYLREVSHYDLLSPDAERALAHRTARGEPAALDEMISRNLRLVIYWAKRYRNSGLPIQDLIQEGNLGLMRAAEKFDPGKGTRFSTYASWWIRQALVRAICDKRDIIRIPVHMHQKMQVIDRMLESMGALESTDANIEEAVDGMELIPFVDWQRAHRLQQSVSLDRGPFQERGGVIEVEDQNGIDPIRGISLRELKEHLSTLLKELPSRQQTVLRLRYGLNGENEHSLESIGSRLHISRERVRQIQAEAIAHMAESAGLSKSAPPVARRRARHDSLARVRFSARA